MICEICGCFVNYTVWCIRKNADICDDCCDDFYKPNTEECEECGYNE